MRVSTVIPNHNDGPTLARSIRYALSQTLPPCEILVLDDASTDDSRATVRELARETGGLVRLHAYGAKSDDWTRDLFAHAASLAAGDYVHLFSANDHAYPGLYAACAAHQGSGVILTDLGLTDAEGRSPTEVTYDLAAGAHGAGPVLLDWLRAHLPSGVTALQSREALSWADRVGVWRVGPWADSIGLPLAGWRWGLARVPGVHGAYTCDEHSFGGGRTKTPALRRRYWEEMQALAGRLREAGGFPGELLDSLCARVRADLTD